MSDGQARDVVVPPAAVALIGRVATDPIMRRIQTSFILKGITITGAALLITQLGVGAQRGE